MDVGLLHVTKLTQDIHTLHSAGYGVGATEAESQHYGVVAVV